MENTFTDFSLSELENPIFDLGATALLPYDTLQYWPKVEDLSRNDET